MCSLLLFALLLSLKYTYLDLVDLSRTLILNAKFPKELGIIKSSTDFGNLFIKEYYIFVIIEPKLFFKV